MTEAAIIPRSGWCPPWRHDSDHKECQRRLDRGLLERCGCPDHPTTTNGKAA